ncbi:MAG TPA: UvrD-helicase domain-containing protein [Steroidobacteraceae bacterium]|nr:UvrD-helicase domain-containing protein [Steroidobacteraceae bacterium]
MNELSRADAEARERALDPQRSILLQAPAGSGKTSMLTQRFLRLLCTVDDPGEILAITFTRKAAAEMRARVTQALRGEIAADDPCAAQLHTLTAAALRHGTTRGWNLAHDPGALRIQTIDSFTYWLASQLPIAARAGGTLRVTETPQELYRRAARRTLLAAEADAVLGADTELLFERLDNHWNNVERLLADMLEQRAHWLRYVLETGPGQLCARVNASLADIIRDQLAAASAALPPALLLAARQLPGVGPLGNDPTDLPAWKRLAHCTLTGGRWRVRLTEDLLGPAYAQAAAREALHSCIAHLSRVPGSAQLLQGVAALPAAALSEADEAAIGALSRVLEHAARELHVEFAHQGRVDYAYVTGAARAALTEAGLPTELALRTGLAFTHILVDEFQDTSLAQFQLLESLTAAWQEGDGRTLFLVGDPMQSIYRFRDAEVGLFISAREHGIGNVRLTPLRLTRNFRATPALVEWTNQVFAQVFPAADELRAGAIAFRASAAARVPGAGAPPAGASVQLRLFPGDRDAEARAVAARIGELRGRDRHASVAVLVAAHAHAVPIVNVLRAGGVEVLGVDLVPLAQRPIVRDLVQLTRALHDLGDRSAWLAVLRAPWCGASLATLTALSGPEDPQLLWEALADSGRLARCAPRDLVRLARVRAVLAGALERRDSAPAADWLEASWVQLGAPDAYPRAELGDARVFFCALAERAAALEWRGPEDFPALLQDLYSAAQAPGANPVQVMTIHRAKGLEFDHVLVPGLDRSVGAGERPLLRWIDLPRERGASDLILAPAAVIGEEGGGELNAFLAGLLATRARHERTRLMYVAATRARETLHLSAAPRMKSGGRLEPDPRSLLACLWPALAERFQVQAAPAPGAPAPAARRPQALPLRRLRDAWRAPQLPAAEPLPHLPLERASIEAPEFSWVGETQRHIGTVVHAQLALIADAPALPTAEQLEAQRAAVLRQLRREGVPERERAEAANLVLTALERTLADERGRWILDAGHREAHSELALTGVAAGRLRSVVIDRCFVDEAGTRWVIDYKSSRHEGGSLESFLEQEMQRYHGQLSGYVALARALGTEPVRAALYFPLLGAFRELT